MMKSILVSLSLAAMMVATSCSQGVATPGGVIRGELPAKDHTVSDLWPGAGEELLRLGCPVNMDTYTIAHPLDGSGVDRYRY